MVNIRYLRDYRLDLLKKVHDAKVGINGNGKSLDSSSISIKASLGRND